MYGCVTDSSMLHARGESISGSVASCVVCLCWGWRDRARTCPLALDAVAVGGRVVEHDLAKEAEGEGAAKHQAF